MRILFLNNLFPPLVIGGYEIACANVARALAGRGHDIRLLTTWSHLPLLADQPAWVDRSLDLQWFIPHLSPEPKVQERAIHASFCTIYPNTLRLLQVVREFRPDIVYVWNVAGIGGVALLDLLNQVKVPWAIHLMDRIPAELKAHVPPTILGLFNAQGAELYATARIISMSQHLVDEIEQVGHIGFPQGVDLIPGWADETDALPHEPYLRDGEARFVTAGTVRPHKGIDLILQASSALKMSGREFKVDIYGDGEIQRYVDMARTLQVDDRVSFKGSRRQPELLKLYAEYDCFLFPTWEREPFGFTPVEAAARGAIPIMTRKCGASERLVDGVHCLKIERNVEDLIEAMTMITDRHVDLEAMGQAGHRLGTSDLSFSHCLDRVEAVLRGHARDWQTALADDPKLPLLAFLKHNLSLALRFG